MAVSQRVVAFILGTFFMLLGAVSLYGFGAPLLDSLRARSWPVAPGQVSASRVARSQGAHGSVFSPHVAYTYEVGGVVYEGDTLTLIPYASNTSYAWDVVHDYPAGARIEVHYDPAFPDRSVLRPGPQWFPVAMTALALLFVLVGASAVLGAFERAASSDPR